MNCGTYVCIPVTCHVEKLLAGQTLDINISLQISQQAVANVKGGATVHFQTSASAQPRTKLGYPPLVDDRVLETEIITTFYPSVPPKEEVALWVIIVSCVGGFLFLLLIAVILWKVGFFKRKKHKEVQDWKRKSGYSRRSKRTSSYHNSSAPTSPSAAEGRSGS